MMSPEYDHEEVEEFNRLKRTTNARIKRPSHRPKVEPYSKVRRPVVKCDVDIKKILWETPQSYNGATPTY